MFAYRYAPFNHRNLIKFCKCFVIFLKTESPLFRSKSNEFTKRLDVKISGKTENSLTSKGVEKTVKPTYRYFIDSAEYFEIRHQAVEHLKFSGESPYPHKFRVTLLLKDFINRYRNLEIGQILKDDICSVAGRVMSKRKSSSKLIFYDLKQEGVKIQIVADASYFSSEEEFLDINRKIRRGDIIGCKGYPYKSSTGELSLKPTRIQTLAPCLHLFPHPYFGLKNIHKKIHQRYLDLLINDSVHHQLIIRSEVIKYIRKFFHSQNFTEVETPYLGMIPSNNESRLFKTYHNKLDMNLNLRMTSGLYLKELIIAEFNKIFEIGRFFKNEATDKTRSSEFTACEFYMAHEDFDYLMKFTETLISEMVKSLTGSYKTKYHLDGPSSQKYEIDFTPPFKRVKMWPFLESALKMTLPEPTSLDSLESNKIIIDVCAKHGIECAAPQTSSKLLNRLVEHFIEKTTVNPTFVCGYPIIMSLLAKQHPDTCGFSERFELFIKKMKIVNGYTALNDPVELQQRFQNRVEGRVFGVDEISMIDETYLAALEHGLPPTVGGRIGIDKLAMILTNSNDIREILWFPLVPPK
ncbi:Lysine--tRNA ligase [Araneus ventricosus]|uniref:Lysine--tRNA ligase n=1 Tax=Araneus ventricosus TaxID=182803 RepID=A0A4Y2C8Z1_ARAVE|nr:Lysine--tRNA ligase [Araneus ventricosus]